MAIKELKNINTRPRYFGGQYLLEDDFELEQDYARDRLHRYTRSLHVAGIAYGLIASKPNKLAVDISDGMAIDPKGRQIVLIASRLVDLNNDKDLVEKVTLKNGDYTLYIGYDEQESDPQDKIADTNQRIEETPIFKLSSSPPNDDFIASDDFIAIAKLTIQDGNVSIPKDSNSVRKYTGLRLPSSSENPLTLRSGGDRASNLAVLSGSLSVTGNLSVSGTGNSSFAGNVGIGTTSPSEKLEVSGNIKATGLSVTGNVGIGIGTTTPKIHLAIGDDDTGLKQQGEGQLAIYTNFQERVRIDATGNVGIGTTSPSGKLDVSGNIKATGLSVTGNVGIGTTSPPIEKLEVSGNIKATGLSVTGNVGIGTTSPPSEKLEVSGNIKATGIITTSSLSVTKSDGNSLLYVRNDGNVGIGTTTPAGTLDVQGNVYIGTGQNNNINYKLAIRGPNQPGDQRSFQDISYEFKNAGSAKIRAYRGTSWDTYLQFLTNPSNPAKDDPQVSLHINHDGNVGIGTASPQNKLDVAGIIRSSQEGFQFPDGSRQKTAVKILAGTMSEEDSSGFIATDMEAYFSGFSITPTIFLSLSRIDNNHAYNLRIEASVKNVTKDRLVVNVKSWADTILYAVTVNWLAFGY